MKLIEKFQIVNILNEYKTDKINFKELCGLIWDKHYEICTFNNINKNEVEMSVVSTLTKKLYTIKN